uniref:Uncharacterized protein LOC104225613 n=1 Tax=Nicotiana sylvestris TaxID=4096 RepID=A0A1U7WAU0_NICSY|nr:PREDICTED: uncharacterized protein LOC104225613 [Nicotiana sylvestris]
MAGENVLLRVSSMKGVMRFGKIAKLSPRFIGPFEILERVRVVAYRITLPPNLVGLHLVFHVYMLRKYHEDRSHVLEFSTVQLDKNLTYEKETIDILHRLVQKLRSKSILSVKVHWRSQPIKDATWESQSDIRSRYP